MTPPSSARSTSPQAAPPPGASIAQSIRALSRAQKSNAGAPLYSRVVNRPAGRVLAAVAHRLGLTPDQVTLLSAACTYTAIALIALWRPSALSAVATSLLLMLGYALDAADGQLARLRHGGSKAGEWLDHVADAIKLSTIHGAIAISLFRFTEVEPAALLVPLAFGAVQTIHFFSYILTYQLRYHGGTPMARSGECPGLLKSVLSAPTDYGLMCLVLMLRFLPQAFLWVYGVMLLGYAGYVAMALPKWYLELRRAS
ncbi:CDP-alcohol phosphatidyltransferase family protein [Actinomyces bowdenii]|uniref:CDP-alcohol phosphatidyltransferase family protein n=1 Tax=Actinomyces bowdenii TaxID=131109 RepID=UPI00214CE6FC|nr:CDP-alcohol phosphatidyltransferase family protein [Actinomyces bowdenii]MCR2053028.1 CDP-alcohol phosphatidyltransferase family protein [Actinomyces bowdenii]